MADSDNNTLTPPPENSTLENYTGSELPYRALYLSGVALAVTSVVFAVALIPMRDAMINSADKRNAGSVETSTERPTVSVLQQSPEAEWQAYEAWMANHMSTFGWQDQSAGIVRIPVDRAVELALAEGLIASTPDAQPASLSVAAHGDDSHASDDHAEPAAAEESAH